MPAEAGIQGTRQNLAALDSRFRGNDDASYGPISAQIVGCIAAGAEIAIFVWNGVVYNNRRRESLPRTALGE